MFEALIILDGDIPPLQYWQPFSHKKILCTDGAANKLSEFAMTPNVIIGDMDSLVENQETDKEKAIQQLFPTSKIVISDDQDTTDFEKALQYTSDNGIRKVLCLGMLGRSADHILHNLALFNRFGHALKLIGLHVFENQLQWIMPLKDKMTISTRPGRVFSFFPLSPCVVSSSGLKWDLKDKLLSSSGHSSIRNQTIHPIVQLHCQGDCLGFIISPEMPQITD